MKQGEQLIPRPFLSVRTDLFEYQPRPRMHMLRRSARWILHGSKNRWNDTYSGRIDAASSSTDGIHLLNLHRWIVNLLRFRYIGLQDYFVRASLEG